MTDREELRERLNTVEDALGDADGLVVETVGVAEEPDGDPDVVIQRGLVMSRAGAKREGREILGPADTPNDRDVVRVRREGHRTGPTGDGAGGDADA